LGRTSEEDILEFFDENEALVSNIRLELMGAGTIDGASKGGVPTMSSSSRRNLIHPCMSSEEERLMQEILEEED